MNVSFKGKVTLLHSTKKGQKKKQNESLSDREKDHTAFNRKRAKEKQNERLTEREKDPAAFKEAIAWQKQKQHSSAK